MMPVALQVFYIILAIVVLGWAGWVTVLVIKHGNILSGMEERCDSRGEWLEDINNCVKRSDRNIIRLGAKLGFEEDLETD